jgi:hypothetical protein
MKRSRVVCLAGLLFVVTSALEISAVRARPSQAEPKRLSSVYALAGEFRTVAANLMWIKADQYHHEFIEHNPDWTKDKDVLGLLNLITDLDPHFVEAYSTGAVIYAYGAGDPKQACAFLDEGIRSNPRAWDLQRTAAIIHARRLHDPRRALPYARAAVRYCDSPFDKPVVERLLRTIERMALESKKSGGC